MAGEKLLVMLRGVELMVVELIPRIADDGAKLNSSAAAPAG